ncbi:MAG: hypothetical protein ACLQDV_08210 [Candidatus Binataceae bacterium]
MDAAANSELLAIEVNVFPAKRERFVWPQAAEDEDGDDRAILSSRGIDKPLRLFQRERIDIALRLAKVFHEDHRVFGDQFTAFRDREDRPQSCNHHVNAPRSDQLAVEPFPLHLLAEKTVDITVIDLVDRFLRDRRGQEHRFDEAIVIVGGRQGEHRSSLFEPRFSELAECRRLWLFFLGWCGNRLRG